MSDDSGSSDSPERAESWAREKRRVGFVLSSVVTGVYFAFVMVIAFEPELLARGLWKGAVSVGLGAALSFLLLTLVVMAGYVLWRERREILGPGR